MHVHFCGFSYYRKLPKIRFSFLHTTLRKKEGDVCSIIRFTREYTPFLRSAQSMRSTSKVGTIRTRLSGSTAASLNMYYRKPAAVVVILSQEASIVWW